MKKNIIIFIIIVMILSPNLYANLEIKSTAKAILNNNTIIKVNGNWLNNGDFTANDSKVIFEGNVDTYIKNAENFDKLSVNKSNGSALILENSISVNDTLNFLNGNIKTQDYLLTLNTSANIINEANGKYCLGNLAISKNIGSNSSDFGGIGVKISSGSTNLGLVTISRTTGANAEVIINTKQSIRRKWEIIPQTPLSDERNLTLNWISDDDNSVNLNFAKLWQSTTQTSWEAVGNMQNASAHSITMPINSLSFFTINSAATINLPESFTFNEDDSLTVDLSPYIQDSGTKNAYNLYMRTGKFTKLIKKSKLKESKFYTISISENTDISAVVDGDNVTFFASENWNGNETIRFTLNEAKNELMDKKRITYFDTAEINILAVNDAPKIDSFFPSEQSVSFTDSLVKFSVLASDVDDDYADFDFEWFIDDVNQAIDDSVFIAHFSHNGNYIVKSIVSDGELKDSTMWNVNISGLSKIATPAIPQITSLSQNYPNPFNPTTRINYQLKESGIVQIYIYNSNGQKIRTLVNKIMQAGYYSSVWEGKNDFGQTVSTGLYFYTMKAKNYHQIKKAVLIK